MPLQPVNAELRTSPDTRSSRAGIAGLPAQIQHAATQQLLANWSADLGARPSAADVTEVLAHLLAGEPRLRSRRRRWVVRRGRRTSWRGAAAWRRVGFVLVGPQYRLARNACRGMSSTLH